MSRLMRIHTIAAQTHGRYVVRDGPPEHLFLGFHGYAQNAEIHMADLETIPGIDAWTVVAVQALNRFYLGRTTDTAGCWMTRQDRELVIADNVAYVRAVAATFPAAETIVVEGFSQGAAMAYRAAASLDRVAGVVILGGDVPPDVDGPLPPVLIGRGKDDDWYTDEKLKKDLKSLDGRARVETAVFPARHEWTDTFRSAAGEFLSRVLTSQHVDHSVR
ncbi:MAG TPA: phospholipase [Thermoanaerobaculia bacterium]|nr:phospholipase [Thermoanaerobaculia bacterium]